MAQELAPRRVFIRNVSGETIPAYAVVKLTDAARDIDKAISYDADKPDGEDGIYHLNGRVPIPADQYASITLTYPTWALYDTGDGTPANAEEWGPTSGSWELSSDGTGFTIVGLAEAGRVIVERAAGAGASQSVIQFEGTGHDCSVDPPTVSGTLEAPDPDCSTPADVTEAGGVVALDYADWISAVIEDGSVEGVKFWAFRASMPVGDYGECEASWVILNAKRSQECP